VLRCGGRLFQNSKGSAATYKLSSVVTKIETFISHNWCVPRWKKYLCLALHFNAFTAVLVTLIVMLAFSMLSAFGFVPVVQLSERPVPEGFLIKFTCVPTFLGVLLLAPDFLRCWSRCNPICFLDKTCIHQEDKGIQRRGIQRLGAFLAHSDSMVIIYTDVYLTKLWTVYEVASFLALHSVEQMWVMPTLMPQIVVFGLVLFYLSGVIGFVLWSFTGFLYAIECAVQSVLGHVAEQQSTPALRRSVPALAPVSMRQIGL